MLGNKIPEMKTYVVAYETVYFFPLWTICGLHGNNEKKKGSFIFPKFSFFRTLRAGGFTSALYFFREALFLKLAWSKVIFSPGIRV